MRIGKFYTTALKASLIELLIASIQEPTMTSAKAFIVVKALNSHRFLSVALIIQVSISLALITKAFQALNTRLIRNGC